MHINIQPGHNRSSAGGISDVVIPEGKHEFSQFAWVQVLQGSAGLVVPECVGASYGSSSMDSQHYLCQGGIFIPAGEFAVERVVEALPKYDFQNTSKKKHSKTTA